MSPQIDRELKALRSRRCSFELPRGSDSVEGQQGLQGKDTVEGRSLLEQSDSGGGNDALGASSGGHSGVDGSNGSVGRWQRDPLLPSWNRSVVSADIAIAVYSGGCMATRLFIIMPLIIASVMGDMPETCLRHA